MNESVIIRNSRGALACAFFVGVVSGVLAGGALVRKAMHEQMAEQVEEEFERLRTKYGAASLTKPWPNPQEAVAELHPEIEKVSGFVEPPRREHVAYEKIVEFKPGDVAPDEDIDPEEQHALEAEFGPELNTPDIYPINAEVFAANEKEYVQESLWYYPEDGVVADQRDNKLESNHEKFLGVGFHMRFGSGDDPHTVYVRNDKLAMDYEITLMPNGNFKRDVAGIIDGAEEQPSDRQRINGM